MDRKLGAVAVLWLLAGSVSAANFCAVTSMGANCSFPDLGSCQMHLQGVGGQCVVNPQSLPQPAQPLPAPVMQYQQAPALQHPDIAGAALRSYQQAQQQRQSQEEHAARMRLLDAQAQAARQQHQRATPSPVAPDYVVLYRCPGADPEYTSIPAVGCVVVAAAEL